MTENKINLPALLLKVASNTLAMVLKFTKILAKLCCLSKWKYLLLLLVFAAILYPMSHHLHYVKDHLIILNQFKRLCSAEPISYKVDILRCPFTSLSDVTLTKEQNAPIVLTFANAAWLNVTKNWICHARKSGLKRTLVVAFSKIICDQIKSPDLYCWYPNITINGSSLLFSEKIQEEGTWGTPVYQSLMKLRTPVLYSLLKCNRNILLTDNDLVFLQNPLDYLNKRIKSVDVIFQKDSTGIEMLDWLGHRNWLGNFYVCAGFMYMKPSEGTFSFLRGIMAYQEMDWNDQAGINICLYYDNRLKIRWATLPSHLFPNGPLIKHGIDRERKILKPYVYHFNWMNGIKRKVSKMKDLKLWCPIS